MVDKTDATATAKVPPPAATPAPAPAAPTYVADASYEVTLSRVVEWPKGSGMFLRPIDHQILAGAVCTEIADGIASAQLV